MHSNLGKPPRPATFGPFRLDPDRHRLWRGQSAIALRPKSWDVLCYLIEHAGVLVTKEALHEAIWHGAAVSEDSLTQCIGELRRVLGDSARRPRFIETVHRRGFRFIATLRDPHGEQCDPIATEGDGLLPAAQRAHFVGREAELERLAECLRIVGNGTRQTIFVTGEAGIGKTALIGQFLQSRSLSGVPVLHGECVHQHGQREAYMPVIQAIERWLRTPAGAPSIALLRQVAPLWHALMPALHSTGDPPVTPDARKPPTARMLREIATFIELITADSMAVLVLEDLHWADPSTTDLLAHLAQRRDPAKLLIIASYRLAEAAVTGHPIREVKQTLLLRRQGAHLQLGYLTLAEVNAYVQARFDIALPDLASVLHRRTDGNPLFVIALIDELIRCGWLEDHAGRWRVGVSTAKLERAVPDDVREMITSQIQRLSDTERSVLEVGSVLGVAFTPRTIAAVLGDDEEAVEDTCQRLLNGGLFLSESARPDRAGMSDASYQFVHVIHRQVLYEHLSDSRRRRLHRACGDCLEAAWGARGKEIAADLSLHFELGGDLARAFSYLGACVAQAQQRAAHREAVASAERALALAANMTASPEWVAQELQLRIALNPSLNVTYGYRSPEVRANCAQAQHLCEMLSDRRRLFEVVQATWYVQGCGSVDDGVWQSVDDLARIAAELASPALQHRARLARGRTQFWNARFSDASETLGHLLQDAQRDLYSSASGGAFGVDAGVAAHTHYGLTLWFLGYPDRARQHTQTALARAAETNEPFDRASALVMAALADLWCGSAAEALEQADAAMTICRETDIAFFAPVSRFLCGAARVQRGEIAAGLAEMLPSLAEQRTTTGPFFCDVILTAIADALVRLRQWDVGLEHVEEGIGLSETLLERIFSAELWRLKGLLLLGKSRSGGRGSAQAQGKGIECLHRALTVAQEQHARSLALRVAIDLVSAAAPAPGENDARAMLRALHAEFTEGRDTKDLIEAGRLLGANGVGH